jgi:hypothetical protein
MKKSKMKTIQKNKRKLRFSRKTLLIIFSASALSIFSLLFLRGLNILTSRNNYIAKVNGEIISMEEFERQFNMSKANVTNYFHEKYGVQMGKYFWTTNINGEVPLEVAKQRTLDECVKIKLQEKLAKEKGILADISQEAFLGGMKAENDRRSKAIKSNQPVYGPKQLDENTYFSYFFNNMIIKLKEKLAEKELKATDEELEKHYTSVRDKLYTYEDTIKISMITLAVGEEEKVNSEAKEERLEIIKELKERLDKGEDFEKVLKDATSKGIKGLTTTARTLDKDTARNNSREEPLLLDAVNNLSPYGISDVFEENSSLNIAKCIDRKEGGYKSFEDVKENVKSSYINERYDEIIRNLIKDASIEVNDKVYQSIKGMD